MAKFIDEFKAFAMRGNVLDLALAVIIGAAFGKIVSSLVENILMPPLGFLIGGVNFSDLSISLSAGIGEPVLITYGLFVQSIVDFVIIALVLFMVVKGIAKLHAKKEEVSIEEVVKTDEVALLEEIRDLLKAK